MYNKLNIIIFISLLFIINLNNATHAQEQKNDIFSITPAVSFAWYPYSEYMRQESTNIESSFSNYGISFIMGLKLYDKLEAHLNLEFDDPTFQKMVDIAGYISVYSFMLNFDYHFFEGTATWKGNTPDPIKDGKYNFNGYWNSISLLYNNHSTRVKNNSEFLGFGITYSSFKLPVEYKVKKGRGLSNPGFGMVEGNAWGLTLLADSLIDAMELPHEIIQSFLPRITISGHNFNLWFYVDIFYGMILQNAKIDKEAHAWMVENNGGVPIDSKITRKFSPVYSNDDDNDDYSIPLSIMKFSIILGIQKVWDIGNNGRIGLALGGEIRGMNFYTSSRDIAVGFDSFHVGPAIRLSARW